jgi:hypothetical protein
LPKLTRSQLFLSSVIRWQAAILIRADWSEWGYPLGALLLAKPLRYNVCPAPSERSFLELLLTLKHKGATRTAWAESGIGGKTNFVN